MKRSGPIDRKTPLKPGAPPERKTPMNRVNRKRKAERHKEAYGEDGAYGAWIRTLSCVLAGTGACEGRTEAAHAKSRGAGGDATELVPMCSLHHAVSHQVGRNSFRLLTGIDVRAVAARLVNEWNEKEAA